jgi:hypothetical protein
MVIACQIAPEQIRWVTVLFFREIPPSARDDSDVMVRHAALFAAVAKLFVPVSYFVIGGGRSVGIVRSRTKATELVRCVLY